MIENIIEVTNPGTNSIRYPVTQEQIDDILNNELKNFEFPVKPVYNPRIKDNGATIAEVYKWGQLKEIKRIDIGKQDKPDKKFLIDTLLHEYYESEIFKKQYDVDFFAKLVKSGDDKRHEWIYEQINNFFTKQGDL